MHEQPRPSNSLEDLVLPNRDQLKEPFQYYILSCNINRCKTVVYLERRFHFETGTHEAVQSKFITK